MKITVITPTYNSQEHIEKNVKSILEQTYENFEHIIIDNLSDDGTLNIIIQLYEQAGKAEKLKIISEKDSGISEAFNKGIKTASGDIICILNSDDYYFNDKTFERVLNAFKHNEILYVHGNIYFYDPVYGSNIRKPLLCPITRAMPFNHPTMFFRKEVYQEYGLYDTEYNFAMDFEFICRLTRLVDDFYSKGYYEDGEPLVKMLAGGNSWKYEMATIDETKKALHQHGFWNFSAIKNFALRKLRAGTKNFLYAAGMEKAVKFWRKRKWDI